MGTSISDSPSVLLQVEEVKPLTLATSRPRLPCLPPSVFLLAFADAHKKQLPVKVVDRVGVGRPNHWGKGMGSDGSYLFAPEERGCNIFIFLVSSKAQLGS